MTNPAGIAGSSPCGRPGRAVSCGPCRTSSSSTRTSPSGRARSSSRARIAPRRTCSHGSPSAASPRRSCITTRPWRTTPSRATPCSWRRCAGPRSSGVKDVHPVWAVLPFTTNEQGTPEELRRALKATGVKGVLLYPAAQGFSPAPWCSGTLYELLERDAHADVRAVQSTGFHLERAARPARRAPAPARDPPRRELRHRPGPVRAARAVPEPERRDREVPAVPGHRGGRPALRRPGGSSSAARRRT